MHENCWLARLNCSQLGCKGMLRHSSGFSAIVFLFILFSFPVIGSIFANSRSTSSRRKSHLKSSVSSRKLCVFFESTCAFSFLDPDYHCIFGHLCHAVFRLRHGVGLLKRPAYVKLNSSLEQHSPGTVAGDNADAGFVAQRGEWL